ncbi:MAG: lysozyme inhibitor LprI family protein [Erythrobacter sp.]|nr:lysozyme inhibitor LprI family protein [Erythrobacter sp.]
MNRLFATVTVLFLTGCSGLAANSMEDASEEGSSTPVWYDELEFSNCMEAVDLGAFKNSQWLACHESALERFDSKLNRAYSSLQQKLSRDEDLKRLRTAQREWMGFRDSYCVFAGSLELGPTPEINRMACLIEITAEQAQRLEEAY